ncbi:uncharacterized protein FIBRA_07335 [Fibroporia radiculosa]|uniref:Aminoglycoside phosphotransferase domain-containing protein n=1 Tax=Fibroporia radiculosa TaxID=599839 RepID=J4I0I2_9APHY|nr:uncharacterized protein FIBRA_07335 [Fibroporia radiculosa]CCM05127.1 predicted protein [Fibroporia radiculosa]
MVFLPAFYAALPPLPPTDWTQVYVSLQDGAPLAHPIFHTFPSIPTCWHPKRIDLLSPEIVKSVSLRVQLVRWQSRLAIIKFARFEFEISLAHSETVIYQEIDGEGIGPAFLGHLTENDRVIGFLMEYIEGRFAGIDDLAACQTIVRRPHALEIVHGDLNRYNFVIKPDGSAILIDFEYSSFDETKEEMEKELGGLADKLASETGSGDPIPRPMVAEEE